MAQKPQFDLVALGECLVEFRKELSGSYSQSYAGDVFNTLYYASRLGLRTGFISQFGNDTFTNGLLALCDKEGINHSICRKPESRQNGLYFINTDASGQPTYSFWRKGSAATQTLKELPFDDLLAYVLSSKNVLFSAIGLAVLENRDSLFELLSKVQGKVRVHFDMNVRRSLWEDLSELRKQLERLAKFVDVIFVSSSDVEHVFGKRSAGESIDWFCSAGYKSIVYRNGEHPTHYWSEASGAIEVPAVRNVKVVDATGAGDAFNAGFIYTSDRSSKEAIEYGNACGVIAVTGAGALLPAFSKVAVEELLRSTYK